MTETVERCPDFGAHVVQPVTRELERLGTLIGNWKKTTDECFDAKDARIRQLESELATLREREQHMTSGCRYALQELSGKRLTLEQSAWLEAERLRIATKGSL